MVVLCMGRDGKILRVLFTRTKNESVNDTGSGSLLVRWITLEILLGRVKSALDRWDGLEGRKRCVSGGILLV